MYFNMNMNIWEKLMTALRGIFRETAEDIVDSQAMRILDQEMHEAEQEFKQSRASLVEIIARQKFAESKALNLTEEIKKNEDYARQALVKKEQELALEVAEKIVHFQAQLTLEKETAEVFANNADQLRAIIKQAETHIKRIKYELESVKATENVQRAQAAVLARQSDSNSSLSMAIDSLDRMKKKQALQSARMDAASEIISKQSNQSLNQRLEDAGIALNGKTADEILAQLQITDKSLNKTGDK